LDSHGVGDFRLDDAERKEEEEDEKNNWRKRNNSSGIKAVE